MGRGTFCMLAYQQVTLCILVRESEKRCGVTCCILINLRFRNEKVTSSNPVSGTSKSISYVINKSDYIFACHIRAMSVKNVIDIFRVLLQVSG